MNSGTSGWIRSKVACSNFGKRPRVWAYCRADLTKSWDVYQNSSKSGVWILDMMIWWYDDMVIWWYDDMTIWRYDDMMMWWYGEMMTWWYDDMMVWWYDGMMIWWDGGMMICWYDDMIWWMDDGNFLVHSFAQKNKIDMATWPLGVFRVFFDLLFFWGRTGLNQGSARRKMLNCGVHLMLNTT